MSPGDPERRERRHQAPRRLAGLVQPPELDQARHQEGMGDVEPRVRLDRPLRVRRRLLVAAGEEVGVGQRDQRPVAQRVERAQPQRPLAVLDRRVVVPGEAVHHGAGAERQRGVRVERHRPAQRR